MKRIGPRVALLIIMFLVAADSIGLPVAIIAIKHAEHNSAKIAHNAAMTSDVCKGQNVINAILVSEIISNIPVVLKGTPPALRSEANKRMRYNAYLLRPKKC